MMNQGDFNSFLTYYPNTADYLLLGTEGVAKFNTTDYTWEEKSGGLGGTYVGLVLNPWDSKTLYLMPAEQSDLYTSVDGGKNWDYLSSQGQELSNSITDGNTIFRMSGERTYLLTSTDGGKTWTRRDPANPHFFNREVIVHPYRPDVLYSSDEEGMVISYDEGINWEFVIEDFLYFGLSEMVFSENQPDLVYVVAHRYGRSEDMGRTWQNCGEDVGGWPTSSDPMSVIDPRDDEHLLVATWGGIISTRDGCRTWEQKNNGLNTLKINTISADPNNPDTIYAGTDNGAYISYDSGDLWQPINDGLLGGLVIYSIVVDIDSNVYASTPLGVFQLEAK